MRKVLALRNKTVRLGSSSTRTRGESKNSHNNGRQKTIASSSSLGKEIEKKYCYYFVLFKMVKDKRLKFQNDLFYL